jgi:predicted MFS family arabinose efflux permease
MAKSIFIWLVLSFFYAYQYVIRTIPAISLDEIIRNFSIDTGDFGFFCGIYYIGYTAAAIPLSIMMDKLDARNVIVCTILMAAIGILPLLGNSWSLAVFGRVLSAIGSAGAILGLFKVISVFFKPEQSTRMLGMSVTIGLLGGIYGGQPLAIIISKIGFKITLYYLAAAGIAMGCVAFLLLPRDFAKQSDTNEITFKSIINDIREIFSNKPLILLAIGGGLMVGPLEGFADGWSIISLQVIHGWNKVDASIAPSMIYLGMCIGSSVIGYITERTQKYYGIVAGSSLVMIFTFMWILYGKSNWSQVTIISLFIIGIACAYQIVVMSKAGMLAGKKLVTTGTAIANMIVMVFGSLFHSVIAGIVTAAGGVESPEAIRLGMLSIVIGLALALPVLWMSFRSFR